MSKYEGVCASYKDAVEKRLGELLAGDGAQVGEAMRYSALGGGKRIRAII